MDGHLHWLSGSQCAQSYYTDAILLLNLLVILRISKGQGQDPLLLQIRLVNSSKALCDNCAHIQEAGRHRGMFTAAPLAVVLITDHDRTDAFRFITASDLRHGQPRFARQNIRTLAWLGGKYIVRTQEHIVADLV